MFLPTFACYFIVKEIKCLLEYFFYLSLFLFNIYLLTQVTIDIHMQVCRFKATEFFCYCCRRLLPLYTQAIQIIVSTCDLLQ